MTRPALRIVIGAALLVSAAATVLADDDTGSCNGLPSFETLQSALKTAVAAETSGMNLNRWAVIVDRDGNVCAVAFSGLTRGAQFSAGRLTAAQKANTANLFNLDGPPTPPGTPIAANAPKALSTSNLFSALQPGGILYGLQDSSPLNIDAAFKGPATLYGTSGDPLVGIKIGGVNAFGGGLALYTAFGKLVGGVGVSGDTSCADHNVAWRVRNLLNLDRLVGLASASGDQLHPDNIVFDLDSSAKSASGFGSPKCANTAGSDTLPPIQQ
jgi:uncharacterized protein GlcG (DUF336 family)